MKGIVFQDIFSNLFLGILVLLVLTLKLSGPPEFGRPTVTECEATIDDINQSLLVAFAQVPQKQQLGAAVWTRFYSDLPTSIPKNEKLWVEVQRGGCALECYTCVTDVKAASVDSTQGKISVGQPCTLMSCERSGS